jgi:hypothetical protein
MKSSSADSRIRVWEFSRFQGRSDLLDFLYNLKENVAVFFV